MIEITRDQAVDNILLFAREGRLVRHQWSGQDKKGRHIACLLGSIHEDIDEPAKCPANVMPLWMAELLPALFDGVVAERAVPLGIQFAEALRVGNTDNSVMQRWLIRVVEGAVADAAPKINPAPDYWHQVKAACDQVIAALRTGDKDEAAAKAAGAAAAKAAKSAEAAAAKSAEAAAAKAAKVAAWATAKAAWAAAEAAAAAGAAAGAAAYDRLFVALIGEMLRGVQAA
jgi:hypothetical protein